MTARLVVWFNDVGKDDVAHVGEKGIQVGELTRAGFPVSHGFIISTATYQQFIQNNHLGEKINSIIQNIAYDNLQSVEHASRTIKTLILRGTIPTSTSHQLFHAYKKLGGIFHDAAVSIHPSVVNESQKTPPINQQNETIIKGEANLILQVKEIWATLFSSQALIFYKEQGVNYQQIGIAAIVQQTIEPTHAGIMSSIDPVTNDKNTIIIEAIYGSGELLTQGVVTPDHYVIDKETLKILTKQIHTQSKQVIKKGTITNEITLSKIKGKEQKLSDHIIAKLALFAKKLEKHYYFPQDTEWAIENGKVYILQTHQLTTIHEKEEEKETELIKTLPVILSGESASPGIVSGPVVQLTHSRDIAKVQSGDILVVSELTQQYLPAVKKIAGLITDIGDKTSYAAMIAREIGIPAVVNTKHATKQLKDGNVVTIQGTLGEVYKGGHIGRFTHITPQVDIQKTATKVYISADEPSLAIPFGRRTVDGIGVLRSEHLIKQFGIHPQKLVQEGKKKEFIEHLADGIAAYAQAFAPRPVIYKLSDLHSSAYRELVGGETLEPIEKNPSLGLHGAYRYIKQNDVFEMELSAVKRARNALGCKNVWLLLPFVRTVDELLELKQLIGANGLHRSPTFKLWMSIDIPANIIVLDKLIGVGIDGLSIELQTLATLLLGTDQDSPIVASAIRKDDPALLWSLEKVIKTAHTYHIPSSLIEDNLLQYPDVLEKVVRWGISSVTVKPDTSDTIRKFIAKIEHAILEK